MIPGQITELNDVKKVQMRNEWRQQIDRRQIAYSLRKSNKFRAQHTLINMKLAILLCIKITLIDEGGIESTNKD